MKKCLFFIGTVFYAFLAQAQTNTVYVAPNTDVKVKSNTLFYVKGDMKVDNYTESTKKVSNEGKVRITDKLETSSSNNGSSFVNELPSTGKYGQLIVESSADGNIGKITSVIKIPSKDNFVFMPLAIPYKGITATNVVQELFDNVANAFPGYHGSPSVNYGFDRNRIKNALFTWNNNKFQYDHLKDDYGIGQNNHQADYYAINAKYSSVGKINENKKNLTGVPVKENVTVILEKYSMGTTGTSNIDTNEWGEAYGSYIIDFMVDMPNNWSKYQEGNPAFYTNTGFGSRIYNLGNPYTSNINLMELNSNFLNNVQAIVQYRSQDYDIAINGGHASGSKGKNTVSYSALTGVGVGDPNIKTVAPFQTFAVKMKSDMPSPLNVEFTDNVKTFDTTITPNFPLINTMFGRSNQNTEINQLGIDLYDNEENITSSRVYIAASKIYSFDDSAENEIYNVAMNDKHTGIYTLQENEDGTVRSEARTYINGINSDKYIAKPIHLVFQNGDGQYTIKARLNKNLEKNKNAFYFEDKETGRVIKVGKDFSYTFNVNGTVKDRFVFYWAATPSSITEKEIAKEEVNNVVVYKDQDTYKVRFDKAMKNADVFVYNISGQLVNTSRKVDTSNDYVLPIKGNASVYIVKIVGDNGTVVTKKIIK